MCPTQFDLHGHLGLWQFGYFGDASSTMPRTVEVGSLVYVRYRDHVLFKDSDASQYRPWVRECVGWLDYEDEEYVRVVWEQFHEPNPPENAKLRSTGLAILKKAIVEMRGIA